MEEQRWQAPSNDGIREQTSEAVNRRIDRETQGALDEVGDSPDLLRARLAELDREWSIDRALMLNFAVVGGLSSLLAMRNLRRDGRAGGWGLMFFTQIGFLAHHAIRRWCPPMALFRRLGFRSDREIDTERAALQRRLEAFGE